MSELVLEQTIPQNWTETKLDDICELIGGGTPSRQNPEYFNGNILWLTPTEIPKNKITKIHDSKEKITELGLKKSSAKIIPKNSVLLTSRASIGYVAIADLDVTTNQGFSSFVCTEIINNYFLAYWLFGNKNLLESKATGTTFKEISKSKLRELKFQLPPLNEQKRITEKIEELLSKINLTKCSLEHIKLQLITYRQSLLKSAFDGKLTEDYREKNKDSRSMTDSITDYHTKLVEQHEEKSKKSKSGKAKKPQNLIFYEPPTEIPHLKNWARTNLVNFCTLQRGFDLPKSVRKKGKYPILSSSGITGYHSEYKVRGEGVTIGRSGSIGNVTYSNGDYWPLNTTLFVLDFNENYPKFVYYFLQFFKAERFGASTAVPTLDRKLFFKEKINVPPLEEQKQIVIRIEQGLSLIENNEKIVNSTLLKLATLQSTILKQAFEGKLVPQDPNDKPVEILLQKTKQEKQQLKQKQKVSKRKKNV